MNLTKQQVNERLEYLRRMERGNGWDGMRAQKVRELNRHYLEPLKARVALKPDSATGQAVAREIARVEAELKAIDAAVKQDRSIVAQIVGWGFEQQRESMNGAVDFDEAVRLWAEFERGGMPPRELSPEQERMARKAWAREFGGAQ